MGMAFVSCTPQEDACLVATDKLVADIQRYVDKFSNVAPSQFAEGKSLGADKSLPNALVRYRQAVGAADCDIANLRQALVDELTTLHGEGVIAQTLATTLRVSLSSASSLGSADLTPQTVSIEPGRDLGETVAGAIPGSTIRLGKGEYRMGLPLIILESVAIVGSGKDATRIISTAPGAALIFFGGGDLRIEDVTLEHSGEEDASLLILRGRGFTIRNSRFTGARASQKGGGGIGMIAGAELSGGTSSKNRTMRIESSEFINNSGGGILIDGDGSPTISKISVRGSEVCGVCFQGNSSGKLTESDISSNGIGVTVSDSAFPGLDRNTFSSNNVAILVGDESKPVMTQNRYVDSKEAALVFSEQSGGATKGDTCEGLSLGVVLLQKAIPELASSACRVNDLRSDILSKLIG